jgi:hypothetical protein
MLCEDEKLLSAEARIHENADFIAQLTAYILFPRYIANNEHMKSLLMEGRDDSAAKALARQPDCENY